MKEVIRKLKLYLEITNVGKTELGKQSGLSRYTIINMVNHSNEIDFEPLTLNKINKLLDEKLAQLDKLRKGEL